MRATLASCLAIVCIAIWTAAGDGVLQFDTGFPQTLGDVSITALDQVNGATVFIANNFQKGDQLSVSYGGSYTILAQYNASTGKLAIAGVAPASEYKNILGSITFTTTSRSPLPRTIVWNFGIGVMYNPVTQHYYSWFPLGQIGWDNAQSYCLSQNYYGLTGYLATVTSQDENDFIYELLAATAYLGGTANIDKTWRWSEGPEGTLNGGRGKSFWGTVCAPQDVTETRLVCTGTPVTCISRPVTTTQTVCTTACRQTFCPWNIGQPLGSQDADYASMLFASKSAHWEDIQDTALGAGFVCEFGDQGTNPPFPTFGQTILFPKCAQFQTAMQCQTIPFCTWTGSCSLSTCAAASDVKTCARTSGCQWNGNSCQRKPCLTDYSDQSTCNADSNCVWDIRTQTCEMNECARIGVACQCSANSKCFWNPDSNQCISNLYGLCPNDMDILLLFDSPKEGTAFTTNVHYAVVEQLRSWISTLPLTGTGWGTTPPANSGIRIAAIEYGALGQVSSFNRGSSPGLYSSSALTQLLFSGKQTEINLDLNWMEDGASLRSATYISAGLNSISQLFANEGVNTRRKVAIILSYNQWSDSGAVTSMTLPSGIEVVAISPLPTSAYVETNTAPLNALQRYLKAPFDQRYLSASVVDIIPNALQQICNQNSAIGSVISAGQSRNAACDTILTWDSCQGNPYCVWNYHDGKCTRTPCGKICVSGDCNNDPRCSWVGTRCSKKNCPSYTTSQDCVNAAPCTWSGGVCSFRTCSGNPTEDSCADDPNDCIWKSDGSNSGLCQARTCVGITDYWLCNRTASCTWEFRAGTPSCRQNRCRGLPYSTCVSSAFCMWNNNRTCFEHWCAGFDTEFSCSNDAMCRWDLGTAPAGCRPSECAALTQDLCAADPSCLWDPTVTNPFTNLKGVCQRAGCKDYSSSRCQCARLQGCYPTATDCVPPALENVDSIDFYVLIDHGAGMYQGLDRHQQASNGVFLSLRNWAEGLSYSGTPAGTVPGPIGARVTFIQYGDQASPITAPTTGGNPSGDRTEVLTDLTWHFMHFGSSISSVFLNDALKLVADKAAKSPVSRKKAVIILARDDIADAIDSYETGRVLASIGVKVYAMPINMIDNGQWDSVVGSPAANYKLFTKLSNLDSTLASQSLINPTNSEPLVACSMLQTREQCLYNKLCTFGTVPVCPRVTQCPNLGCLEPLKTGEFKNFKCEQCRLVGGVVECRPELDLVVAYNNSQCYLSPCTVYCNAADCGNNGCNWDSGSSTCQETPCSYTDQLTCTADSACAWDTVRGSCRLNLCTQYTTQSLCSTNSKCGWNAFQVYGPQCTESPCGATTVADCTRNNCTWRFDANPAFCQVSECNANQEVDCIANPNCNWISSTESCAYRQCEANSATTCTNDPRCTVVTINTASGTTQRCRAKFCQESASRPCLLDRRCSWTGVCAERTCLQWGDEATCNAQGTCQWDTTQSPGACVDTDCSFNGANALLCGAVPTCIWKSSAAVTGCFPKNCTDYTTATTCALDDKCTFTGSGCRSAEAIGCSQSDIVFVFGDSYSFGGRTGRHPSGFIGALEVLRRWVRYTDLTSFRVGFVQFRNGPILASTQMTNSLSALETQLTQHEQTFVPPTTAPPLRPALVAANALLTDMVRTRVIVIITDSSPSDVDASAAYIASLSGVRVFAIGVRMVIAPVPSPSDLATRASLASIAQSNSRTILTYLGDSFTKLFTTMCSQNSFIGAVIGGANPSCSDFTGQVACEQQSRCAWANTPPACPIQGCANLGCMPLRDVDILQGFSCENCAIVNNRIQCTQDTFNPISAGSCVPSPCLQLTQTQCSNNNKCTWDGVGSCIGLECKRYVYSQSCVNDYRCFWDSGASSCKNNPCTIIDDSTPCRANGACQWADNDQNGYCIRKPCQETSQSTCQNQPGCAWVNPGVCQQQSCVHPTESTCVGDPAGCVWDTALPGCRPNRCLKTCDPVYCIANDPLWNLDVCRARNESAALCSSDPRCYWSWWGCVPVPVCRESHCPTNLAQMDCQNNRNCLWNFTSGSCFENKFANITSEMLCYMGNSVYRPEVYFDNATTVWDTTVSPPVCTMLNCSGYTDAYTCNFNGCDWTNFPLPYTPNCIPRRCNSTGVTKGCDCYKMRDKCMWSTEHGDCVDRRACKNADLIFVIDASFEALEPNERSKNGFITIIETIRTWLQTLPLTQTKAGVGVSPSNQGLRVAVHKFCDLAQFCQGTNATGSYCRLTGDYSELDLDLTSLRANFSLRPMSSCLFNADLDYLAATMENNGREKVVVVISTTEIRVTYDRRGNWLQNQFPSYTISSYGVAIRGAPKAMRTLPLVASGGVTPVPLLQFDSFLWNMCDDNGPTKALKNPAGSLLAGTRVKVTICDNLDQTTCVANKLCEWSTSALCADSTGCPQLGCRPVPGDMLMSGYTCSNCRTSGGAILCSKDYFNPVAGRCQQTTCMKNCYDGACAAGGVAGCAADNVLFTCARRLCAELPQTNCSTVPGCVWDTLVGKCRESMCFGYATKNACQNRTNNAYFTCEWNDVALGTAADPRCLERDCPFDQTNCIAPDNNKYCRWNGDFCEVAPCQYSDADACIADKGCKYVPASTPSCVETPCKRYFTETECTALSGSGCWWRNGVCSDRPCTGPLSTCAAFKECEVVGASCLPKCQYQYMNKTTCATTDCEWGSATVGGAETCRRMCSTFNTSATCTANKTYCQWDTTTNKCRNTCTSEPLNQAQCEDSTKRICMWGSWLSPATCVDDCTRLTPAQCATQTYCTMNSSLPCAAICRYRAKTYADCTLNTDCDWDTASATCVEKYCTSALDCEADPRCRLVVGVCMKQCKLLLNSTLCARSTNCYWTSDALGCRGTCESEASMSDCKARATCFWNSTSSCQTRCEFRYTDSVACNFDPQCEWSFTASLCISRPCAYSDSTSCGADTTGLCTWQPKLTRTSVVTAPWGGDNCTVVDLTGYTGCTITNYQQTVSAAGTVAVPFTVTGCASCSSCPYGTQFQDSTQCGCIDSGFIHFAVGNKLGWPAFPAGTATPGNGWTVTGTKVSVYVQDLTGDGLTGQIQFQIECPGVCGRACSTYTSAQQCMDPKNINCTWDYDKALCRNRCSLTVDPNVCRQDSLCNFYSALPAPSCRTRCSRRQLNQAACEIDAACDWADGQCLGNCTMFGSSSDCSNQPHCLSLITGQCVPHCKRFPTSSSCSANSYCMWDNVNQICAAACDQNNAFSTQSACQSQNMCVWLGSSCVMDCSFRSLQTSCTSPYCQWVTQTGTCAPACNRISTSAACESLESCNWQSGQCNTACSVYTISSTCGNDARCKWDATRTICVGRCTQFGTQESCLTSWCRWNFGACVEPCTSFATQAACQAATDCDWNAGRTMCTANCARSVMTNQYYCELDSECTWTGVMCARNCAWSSESLCTADQGCAWNSQGSVCAVRCELRNENTCSNSPNLCVFEPATQSLSNHSEYCYPLLLSPPWTSTVPWDTRIGAFGMGNASYGQAFVVTPNTANLNVANDTGAEKLVFNIGAGFETVKAALGLDNRCRFCSGTPASTTVSVTTNMGPLPIDEIRNISCGQNVSLLNSTLNGATQITFTVVADGSATCAVTAIGNPRICKRIPLSTFGCRSRCSGRYSMEVPCANDPYCMWDAASNICREGCEAKSAGECQGDPLCRYIPNSVITCQRVCKYLIKSACDTNPTCEFVGGVCAPKCTSVRYMDECTSHPNCEWSGPETSTDNCYPRCSIRSDEDTCNQDPFERCTWNSVGNVCRQKCELSTSGEASCISDKSCEWTGTACITQCTFKYDSEVPCQLDSRCMWDPLAQLCRKTCSMLDAVACAANSICMLRNGNCFRNCQYRYPLPAQQPSCDADPNCIWDPKQNKCATACGLSTTIKECRSNFLCQWRGNSSGQCSGASSPSTRIRCAPIFTSQAECLSLGCCYNGSTTVDEVTAGYPFCFTSDPSCIPRCYARYKNATTCAASDSCKWSNGQCVQDCTKFGDQYSCNNNDMCQWTGTACAANCAGAYQDQGSCIFDTNCYWSLRTNVCFKKCTAITDYTQCASQPECQWNLDDTKCYPVCELISDLSTCASTSYCVLDGATCRKSCDKTLTQTDCEINSRCTWSQSQSRCVRACSTYGTDTFACTQNNYCEFTTSCVTPCNLRFAEAASCNAAGVCVWDEAHSVCKKSCDQIKQFQFKTQEDFVDGCSENSVCFVSNGLCVTKCNHRANTEADCALSGGDCEWNSVTASCTLKCSIPKDSTTCNMQKGCVWTKFNNSCVKDCTVLPTQSACQTAGCTWSFSNGVCYTPCQVYTSSVGSCLENSACRWTTTCTAACINAYASSASCNADPGCTWDKEGAACRQACNLIVQENDCRSYSSMCDWIQGTCIKACSLRYTDVDSCNADSGCMWNAAQSVCRASCESAPGQNYCNGDAMCQWRTDFGACKRRCTAYPSQSLCQKAPYCDWSPSKQACQKVCSERYFTIDTCNDADCNWDYSVNACGQSCQRLMTTSSCSSRFTCQWDASATCSARVSARVQCGNETTTQLQCATMGCCYEQSAGPWCFNAQPSCFPKCGTRYLSATDCNADLGCEWNGAGMKCVRRCNVITSSVECGTTELCDWYDGKCQKRCIYAFVTKSTCEVDSGNSCKWDAAAGLCKNNCDRYNAVPAATTRRNLCESDTACRFLNSTSTCTAKCEIAYTDKASCLGATSAQCLWDGTRCRTGCSYYESESPCATSAGDICQWDYGLRQCRRRCDTRATSGDCAQDTRCIWQGTKCNTACIQLNSLTFCTARSDCAWDASSGQCQVNCATRTNYADCTSWASCVYHNTTVNGTLLGCRFSCSYQYKTIPGCNGDVNCVWDSVSQTCQRSCQTYTYSEFYMKYWANGNSGAAGLQSECDGLTYCDWMNNNSVPFVQGFCATPCNIRSSQAATCVQYSDCMWNDKQGTCDALCDTMSNSTCTLNSMCKYNTGTLACTQRCLYKYKTQTGCDGDAACSWDSANGICNDNCAVIADPGTCNQNSICYWNAGNCTPKCSARYPISAFMSQCIQDSQCMYDSSTGGCKTTCSLVLQEFNCNRESMCFWTNGACQKRCDLLANTSSDCALQPACEWDSSVPKCSKNCLLEGVQATCINNQMCQWDSAGNRCRKMCPKVTDMTKCQVDPMCQWNGNSCINRCGLQYTSPSQCNGDASCMWDGQSCSTKCNVLPNEAICVVNDRCWWTSNGCKMKCKYAYGSDQSACQSDPDCAWNSQLLGCDTQCSRLISSASCNANPMCQYQGSKCIPLCYFRYTGPTACLADEQCDWNSVTNACKNTCTRYTGTTTEIQAKCTVDNMCRWLNESQRCSDKCTLAYNSSSACSADASCMWDSSMGQCRGACEKIDSARACLEEPMCTVDPNGLCARRCSIRYTLKTQCSADSACIWDPAEGVCRTDCRYIKSKDQCVVEQAACIWEETSQLCKLKCDLIDTADGCGFNPLCNWQARIDLPKTGSGAYIMRCRRRCGYLYTQKSSCNADPNCMWSDATKVCGKTCERYMKVEDPTLSSEQLAAACVANPQCGMQNGFCVKSCSIKYTSQTACQNDQFCDWDVFRQACIAKCGTITARAECINLPACQWTASSAGTGTCLKQCKYRYPGNASAPQCLADPECVWNSQLGECSKRCNYYEEQFPDGDTAQTMCNMDTLCLWNSTLPAGQRCIKQCPGYADQISCLGSPSQQCMWDGGAQACSKGCPWVQTRDNCVAQPNMCVWRQSSWTPCNFRCELRHRNPFPCGNDTDCMWDSVTQRCIKACGQMGSPEECGAAAMCEWRNSTVSRCVKRCHLVTDYVTCSSDPQCGWSMNNTCYKKCGFAYPLQYQCQAVSSCMWDEQQQICRDDCSTLPIDICSMISMCTLDGNRATCKRKCEFRWLSSTACNSDSACHWDTVANKCFRGCVGITDQNSCLSNPMCDWYLGTCRLQCRYAYPTPTLCATDAACTWDKVSGVCKITCSRNNANQSACAENSNCEWNSFVNPPKCQLQCVHRYSDELTCNGDRQCMWDWWKELCAKDCNQSYTQSDCMRDPGLCVWDGTNNKCRRTCRMRYDTDGPCSADPLCQWDYDWDYCKANCESFQTQTDCDATSDCYYNTKTSSCIMKCEYSNPQQCEDNSQMCDAEADGSCVNKCTVMYTSWDTCSADKKCMWDEVLSVCTRACNQLYKTPDGKPLDQRCLSNVMCRYRLDVDLKSQRCQTKCSYKYKTEPPCVADATECVWDPIMGTCNQKCSDYTPLGQAMCTTIKVCMWSAAQCKPQCPYRYFTPTECRADPDCKWEPIKGVCQQACENYTSITACQNDAMCEYNSILKKCMLPCGTRHTTVSGCRSDTTCMYDNIVGTCTRTCSLIDKQNICINQNMCTFRPNGRCSLKCPYLYPGGSPACKLDPLCMWDDTIGDVCKDGCYIYGNAGDCQAEPMCTWDVGSQKCVKECPYQVQTECNADARCVWAQYQFRAGDFHCKRVCQLRYTTPGSCNLDQQCLWQPSTAKCVPSCEMLSNSACKFDPTLCEVRSGVCKKLCSVKYNNKLNCTQDPECMWDGSKMMCNKQCALIDNQQYCMMNDNCEWYQNKCQLICQYRLFNQSSCLTDPHCIWSEKDQMCRNGCGQYNTQVNCVGDAFCEWDGGAKLCQARCSLKYWNQPSGCVAEFPKCMWNAVAKQCSTGCKRVTSEIACETMPETCSWDVNAQACYFQCNFGADTQAGCEALPLCMWDNVGQVCTRLCSEYGTQASCDSSNASSMPMVRPNQVPPE
jgi:hypothetical protein